MIPEESDYKKVQSTYLKNKTKTTQITLVVDKDNLSSGVSNLG